jgi:hypothetical protein
MKMRREVKVGMDVKINRSRGVWIDPPPPAISNAGSLFESLEGLTK